MNRIFVALVVLTSYKLQTEQCSKKWIKKIKFSFLFLGGFNKFSEMCPEYVEEVCNKNLACNAKYYENQVDQNQAYLDNAVMTQIEASLYLGRANWKMLL